MVSDEKAKPSIVFDMFRSSVAPIVELLDHDHPCTAVAEIVVNPTKQMFTLILGGPSRCQGPNDLDFDF
jgi:hypothetical protein